MTGLIRRGAPLYVLVFFLTLLAYIGHMATVRADADAKSVKHTQDVIDEHTRNIGPRLDAMDKKLDALLKRKIPHSRDNKSRAI